MKGKRKQAESHRLCYRPWGVAVKGGQVSFKFK